jgi:hypothetical protein
MVYVKQFILLVSTIFVTQACIPQTRADSSSYKIISAGSEYKKPKFYRWLWGNNRRVEWTTPVRVPVVYLDSIYGGLRPYQQGGGNETKSLRLKNADGKEFALRSIDKSRNDVVLPEIKGTFIADIIQDEVSMSYPYGAFALPVMQQYAGIPHPNPVLVYLPRQSALDTFSAKFQNNLYLLEERPEGDWSDAYNLGNFKKFSSTKEVIESLLDDNTNTADQQSFAKARLFDMIINDWDRHEDNWRWGVTDNAGKHRYVPVPRDRDQAFYTKNGKLISPIIAIAGLKYMQDFSNHVKDVNMLNFEERNMDRFFTNRMNFNDWINTATELRRELTDTVIIQSVKGMPPEIFNVSGNELIEKLKTRRNELEAIAAKYYRFLAKEVEVVGSKKREYFEVRRLNTGETIVSVFSVNRQSAKEDSSFYKRIFNPLETKEIRIYGVGGEDIYAVYGKSRNIKLRIIGGPGNDSLVQYTGSQIHIYDNYNNRFRTISAKMHLSKDSAGHTFNYEKYNYNMRDFSPYVLFNNRDRWYIGWNYTLLKHRWRRKPYANARTIGINYYGTIRLINASASLFYPNVIGKWNFSVFGSYEILKWTNFFGAGNQTVLASADRSYNRIRSTGETAKAGISRQSGKSSFTFSALFQGVRILNDTSRYVAKVLRNPKEFRSNYYTGIQLTYSYLTLNDSVVPTKGFSLLANAGVYRNITQSVFFQNYAARLQVYLPLSGNFSLAERAGIETIAGNSSVVNNAQYSQHAIIGGPVNIRGYRAERFWGKTAFYNQNELRYITTIKTHLLNAKAGLLAFFDNGRVWLPAENSGILHTSYGGGLLIAPFYKICVTVTYGITNESKLLQVGVNTLF